MPLELARVVQDEIQNGPLLLLPARQTLLSFTGRSGAKEPLEEQARIRLGRHRLGGGAPGEVVLIGAGITGIAIPGFPHGVARQFQRREAGQMPDLVRHDLIDGNAGVDVCARGFFDANACQKRSAGARMITGAVRAGSGVDVVQAAQNLDLIFHRSQRLHRAGQLKVLSFSVRPPGGLDRAVGEINESHAQGRTGRGGSQPAGRVRVCGEQFHRAQCFESGKGQTRAETTKEMAPVENGVALGHEGRI